MMRYDVTVGIVNINGHIQCGVAAVNDRQAVSRTATSKATSLKSKRRMLKTEPPNLRISVASPLIQVMSLSITGDVNSMWPQQRSIPPEPVDALTNVNRLTWIGSNAFALTNQGQYLVRIDGATLMTERVLKKRHFWHRAKYDPVPVHDRSTTCGRHHRTSGC